MKHMFQTWCAHTTHTSAASLGLQTVFAPSAEGKNESRCGCCWRLPPLVFYGVLLWWRHGDRWDCQSNLPSSTASSLKPMITTTFQLCCQSYPLSSFFSSIIVLISPFLLLVTGRRNEKIRLHRLICSQLFPLAANENTIKAQRVLMKQLIRRTTTN